MKSAPLYLGLKYEMQNLITIDRGFESGFYFYLQWKLEPMNAKPRQYVYMSIHEIKAI